MVGASDKEHRSPEIERTIRLGESLVLRGKLTREQLQAVLGIKENGPQRLGEILLSQKLVSGALSKYSLITIGTWGQRHCRPL